MTHDTYITPADGVEKCIPIQGLARLVANCRKNKISVGSTAAVLSQIAASRVWWRRYLRGDISKAEMDRILKQPYHTRGPVNIRPFLNPKWLAKGGIMETLLALTYYSTTAPCMPGPGHVRARPSDLDGDTISFSALLSRKAFVHRCNRIRKQLQYQVMHPLLLDIGEHSQRSFLDVKRETYLQWRAKQTGTRSQSSFNLGDRPIFTSEWTSTGDVSISCSRQISRKTAHRFL